MEAQVNGYEAPVITTISTENGFSYKVTNTHAPETTTVSVEKEWDDDSNRDKIRPASVTVDIMNGETKVGSVTLDENNSWKDTVDGLLKNADGKAIVYTVVETQVNGYEKPVITKLDAENGYSYKITNTHKPDTIEVTVIKNWDDANYSSLRPTELDVNLMRDNNGVLESVNDVNGKPIVVTLKSDNGWTATIGGLFANDETGTPIKYTWQEAIVPAGYKHVSTVTDDNNVTTITNAINKIDLIIVKKLPKYIDNGEEGYTFVFNVQVVNKVYDTKGDPEVLAEYHVGIKMTGSGMASTKIEGIAFDPETQDLIITEEYTAGYKQVGEVVFTYSDDGTLTATIENEPEIPIHTSGIVNVYDDGEYQGTGTYTTEPLPAPESKVPQAEDEPEEYEEPDEE